MRILYHYEQSVFSRRTRLALAHKGLEVELRDPRQEPAYLAEAHAKTPIRTMPVLVEEDGLGLGDSGAIVQYLDLAYPDRPRLFPRTAEAVKEALAIMGAVDVAMNGLVDLATRCFELRNDPAWPAVRDERIGRAQEAIDFVAEKTERSILAGDTWSAADIWAYSAAVWVAALPGRVDTSPAASKLLSLGFTLPSALLDWTKPHAARPDVRAVYGS